MSVVTTLAVLWLDGTGALALLPLFLLAGVLPISVRTSTHYTLTTTELRVRSGPFRWRVPLREVRSITRTRNPLSSPALSLDRLSNTAPGAG